MNQKKIIKLKYEGYCEDQELDDYAIEEIHKRLKDFDWFVYNYGEGDYEGDGNAIFKKDGKFHEASLHHCSCFGPTENLDLKGGKDTLEELLNNCSEDLNKELDNIVKYIKKNLEG